MADNSCFICNETLSCDKIVTVDRGLQTIRNASVERGDEHIDYLQNINTVTVHVECRKNYTKKFNIESYKKRRMSNSPPTSQCSPRKQRSTSSKFDFATLCLFCGQLASVEQERKKPERYSRTIQHVSTLTFKDTVIRAADARNDSYGRTVKNRIHFVYDLVAVNAIYHNTCFKNFPLPSTDRKKGRPADDDVSNAMNEIFYYIENNEDCQFTLEELKGIPKHYIPADRTITTKLIERYGNEIIITPKSRMLTIICFCDVQANILCTSWYENRKKNPKEERLRILQTAASIIREDITSAVVNTEFYPPPSKMLDNIDADIPESLIFLIEEIILKNKRGITDKLKPKCTAISHAIMAAVRPRTFTSPLLIGLSVFIHRRYGSKRLLDILSTLGFAGSYHDAVKYEVSSVCHPQPKIQSSESGSMIQYAADNADINIYTIDGHNTLHIMGSIIMITPKDAVINEESIVKCQKLPRSEQLAMKAHVPLKIYENPQICGFSKITVTNFDYKETSGVPTFNTADLLWMFGKSKAISHLPGWNGFIECLTKKNVNFSMSRILFLPFIHHAASNVNTIYTTLNYALENSKNHGHKTCIITFDQPLYMKAREIVAASESNTELSKVIVRLGGFHMLMSFLGCIGYVMAGSGIKEALSVIYAPNSVDKILIGHAFARSIRGHTLLRLALSTMILKEINTNSDDFLIGYVENIVNGVYSYEDVEKSHHLFEPIIDGFKNKLDELKDRGPTCKLWLQYLEMVSIVHDFIRAERLGNWSGHLNVAKKMIPYFYSTGHFLYAKSTQLYLQDMFELEKNMDPCTFKKFTDGFFTIKRTDKFNSGTWSDMIIEQTLMKSMKTEGGVSRGRSTQQSVLCKWVYGMHAMNTVCEVIENFCNILLDSVDQHVDARDSRITKDDGDVIKLIDWFTLHYPFPQLKNIVSLSTGIIGDEKINSHDAYNVGLQLMKDNNGKTFDKVTFKRSARVLSLQSMSSAIKIRDNVESVVDPLLLFQRISLHKRFNDNLLGFLQYELSPYPMALFEDGIMRKTTKSSLFDHFENITSQLNTDNITYVIDGGFLLHRVIWQKDSTFDCVIDQYIHYLFKHYGSNIIVVFDGYDDNSKNVKAMEQLRRTKSTPKSADMLFEESTPIPDNQEKFFSNKFNKKKFISLLMTKLDSVNIRSRQARDDADVLIVETALEESIYHSTTVVVGEDIDLLILLIGRNLSYQNIYFLKAGRGKVESKIYYPWAIIKYANCRDHILFLHAICGCDTTSAFFRKGKINAFKLLQKRTDLQQLVEIFKQENCAPDALISSGISFILAMYGAPKTENSLDNYRYLTFAKCTRLNKPVQLSSLPPTAAAAQQHIFRVYYQVQTWLGRDLDPQQWGWTSKNNLLEPITTLLPPAPEELLNSIFCNCTKGCGSNCGCRKIGLQCSVICGFCRGQSCFNTRSDDATLEQELNDHEIDPIAMLSAEMTIDDYNIEDNDEGEEDEVNEAEDEEEEEEEENDIYQ